jgi:hypothetical protein
MKIKNYNKKLIFTFNNMKKKKLNVNNYKINILKA